MAARFHDLSLAGVAAVGWTLAFGAALWTLGSAHDPGAAIVCLLPMLVAGVLARTSQADRGQYVARLMAAALMLPILLLFWADGQDWPASGLLLIAFAVVHAIVFVLAVLWLAKFATRIAPAAGAAAVSADVLERRLQSLANLGLPLRVSRAEAAWQFELEAAEAPERWHRVLLTIAAAQRSVGVRERLGARGAAPRNADEASMRSIGDAPFDPARPDASRVSSRVAQTTVVEPARLAAVVLEWSADGGVARADAQGSDATAMLTLLAAVVTRSGYAWQPAMFESPAER